MKKSGLSILLSLFCIIILVACTNSAPEEAGSEPFKIGMMKIASIDAFAVTQQGVRDVLEENGYIDGENIIIIDRSAEGDFATLTTIVNDFIEEEVDLIVTTSTPAAQVAFNATKEMDDPIPVIFNAVTDPFSSGLATDLDEHPDWVVGVYSFPPLEATFDLFAELFPELEVIGYLTSSTEANAAIITEEVTKIAEERGYQLETVSVTEPGEVRTAGEALISRGAEILFWSQATVVTSGVDGLIDVADNNDIPLLNTDPTVTDRGIAVSVGVDLYEHGRACGELVAKFLDGNLNIAETSLINSNQPQLHYNMTAAAAQNIEIPQSITDKGINRTP